MSRKGFTLIEVMLALFITAILITMLSIVFNTALRSYRQGKDLLGITRKGQLILGQMTRELAGAMVLDGFILFQGTDTGDTDSIYFMAPVENASDLDLCEVGYSLSGTDLSRHFLTYSDGTTQGFEYPSPVDYDELNNQPFCDSVAKFNLRYHDGSNWQTSWNSQTQLPEMVEVSVEIQGMYGNPPQVKTFTTWIYISNSINNP